MPAKKKMSDKVDKRRRKKVKVGLGLDDMPVVKWASGRTQKELDDNTVELKKRFVAPSLEVEREVLFEVYAEDWVKTYKLGQKSAGTDENYHTALYHHLIPVFKDRQLRAITSFDLQKFMNGKKGVSRTTLGDICSVVRGVFNKAMAEGVIDRNPIQGLVKPETESTTRRELTDQEIAATLAVGSGHPDGLLLLALYYTGLRRGEVVGLQWRDFDFRAKTLSVQRDFDFKTNEIGKPKTKAALRTIPVPDDLYTELDRIRGIGETFVFQQIMSAKKCRLVSYRKTWDGLRAALREADGTIESNQKGSILTAHYYRHNYASILYNAGVDVLTAQKWLGHADARTTLAIYAHLSKSYELQNAGKLNEAFLKKVAKRLPE